MTPSVDVLRRELTDRALPGGSITIEPHESFIADQALRATDDPQGVAHPIWFVIASLRGMGISVDELCALAHQSDGDTLLFGSCEVTQDAPLQAGREYVTTATVGAVNSRAMRDGSRLDSVEVVVRLAEDGTAVGSVVSTYLFKRASTS